MWPGNGRTEALRREGVTPLVRLCNTLGMLCVGVPVRRNSLIPNCLPSHCSRRGLRDSSDGRYSAERAAQPRRVQSFSAPGTRPGCSPRRRPLPGHVMGRAAASERPRPPFSGAAAAGRRRPAGARCGARRNPCRSGRDRQAAAPGTYCGTCQGPHGGGPQRTGPSQYFGHAQQLHDTRAHLSPVGGIRTGLSWRCTAAVCIAPCHSGQGILRPLSACLPAHTPGRSFVISFFLCSFVCAPETTAQSPSVTLQSPSVTARKPLRVGSPFFLFFFFLD